MDWRRRHTCGGLAATLMKAPVLAAMLLIAMVWPSTTAAASFIRVADLPLVFTAQAFAPERSPDVREEATRALQTLDATLAKAGADLARVVRLTAYVASDGAVADVEALVAQRFAKTFPAFTMVRTPLAQTGAVVAFEAVAVSAHDVATVKISGTNAAIMPAGGKIFISGQAERGSDLASAVRLTMAGLHRSVARLGLKKSDIVHVKAFIKPFADHAAASREIASSFDGGPTPPVVVMEWVSDLFAEIELVVSARSLPTKPEEKITYTWLPWLTKSTRYCNVTHIAAGTPLIFIGAIDGGDAGDPRLQMKTIFERLGSALFDAGSSYRHMAKATYYLAHPAARALLSDIRDVYYDPMRPPAASALNTNGLGPRGRAAMIDIIAVPAK
jgi:enamine deaminase RidA (YjgF/YER057c/UK114 family)